MLNSTDAKVSKTAADILFELDSDYSIQTLLDYAIRNPNSSTTSSIRQILSNPGRKYISVDLNRNRYINALANILVRPRSQYPDLEKQQAYILLVKCFQIKPDDLNLSNTFRTIDDKAVAFINFYRMIQYQDRTRSSFAALERGLYGRYYSAPPGTPQH